MMRFSRPLAFALLFFTPPLYAADIEVSAGQSIQKAIDAAPAGATIKIAPGVFAERLIITKPVTLEGAGWDKTILKPVENMASHTDAEKIAFANSVEDAPNSNKAMALLYAYLGHQVPPTISVDSASNVTLRGLKIQGVPPSKFPGSGSEALLNFEHAHAQVIDCAAVGPCNDGVQISNDSTVDIRHTLVVAVWNTGVMIYTGHAAGRPSRVHLADCDIRNCYYAGVVIQGEGSTIENCRISGAAWHGIRYDNCSPTITGNFIFANARSGIYASGTTHAIIRNNIFWKNEMDAISCWFNNADTVENNTVYDNLREGISVLGNSKPRIANNVLAANPVGISCSAINGEGEASGEPTLQNNWFWDNVHPIERMAKPETAPPGNTHADPKFETVADYEFVLNAISPARQAGAGANEKVVLATSWPIQPEEQAIIPTSDTRDWDKWKKPAAIR